MFRKLSFFLNTGGKYVKFYSTVVSPAKENTNKLVKLYASVCIERMPVITCDMNDLEKRYSNLINEINIRRSLLSNHELRHLKDLERASKKKLDSAENEELVIETAIDFEDKQIKQLKAFKFSERKLGTDFDQNSQNKKAADKKLLQNIDYILDKKLILLVNEPSTSSWQLPKIEYLSKDNSLRQTAERNIKNLSDKFEVDFMGNAPVGVFKSKKDENLVEKEYFFKAQYKSGAEFLASSNKLDFVWIRKDELKDFIKNKDYLECLNNFILDF